MQPERDIPPFCGSATVSPAYYDARTRTGVQITEHILGAGYGRTSGTRTLILPLIGAHNFGHRFRVGEHIVDPPVGTAEPFYSDPGSSPLLLERSLLPDRHGFLQVNLARIAAAEDQSRVAHLPTVYGAGQWTP